MMIDSARHLVAGHRPEVLAATVDRVADLVKRLKPQVICIRGVSGASIGYPVMYVTGVPVINFRKEVDPTHGFRVEGPCMDSEDIERYVIVDDLIDTGATVRAIVDKMAWFGVPPQRCTGIILYTSVWVRSTFRIGHAEIPIYAGAPRL